GERWTKIDVSHCVVENEIPDRSGDLNLSIEHNVCTVHNVERLFHVVIANEHADATVTQPGNDCLNVVHRNRIDPRERLVEHHELRRREERSRYLESPPLTAGKCVRLALAQPLDAQFIEKFFEALRALCGREWERLQNRQNVVFDRQLPKDRRLLRKITNASSRPLVHREFGDVLSVEQYSAGVRLNEANDHIERGRLPGPVRAEQSDYFTLLQPECDVVHDLSAAISLGQSVRFQHT